MARLQSNKNEKREKHITAGGLLFCLLVLSILPTVLSSEMQSRVMGSSGLITYPTATLVITDSTSEGPVPFKIDGQQSYQTGGTYNLTAGSHTVELPSPYTSPISNITYYFSQWKDGNTQNPRVITLVENVPFSLHGLYSTEVPSTTYKVTINAWSYGTSKDPNVLITKDSVQTSYTTPYTFSDIPNGESHTYKVPSSVGTEAFNKWSTGSTSLEITVSTGGAITAYYGQPSPPGPMPSNYLAYTGWENPGTGIDDNRGLSWNWNNWGAEVTRDTAIKYNGVASIRGYKYGDYRLEFKYYQSGLWSTELYQSNWVLIDELTYNPGWWEFWAIREDSADRDLSIGVLGSTGNQYWYLTYVPVQGGYPELSEWSYYIYSNSYTEYRHYAGSTFTIHPHEVPLYRWFRIERYVYRSSTAGIFKIWITDPYHPDPSQRATKLFFSLENACTSRADGYVMGLKLYGVQGVVHWDDLYIYNYNAHDDSLPPPPPP